MLGAIVKIKSKLDCSVFAVPSSDMIYSTIVADLCHLLLSDKEASYLLEIRSHFVLDENSYPLQKDFHLLDFHPDL